MTIWVQEPAMKRQGAGGKSRGDAQAARAEELSKGKCLMRKTDK